MAEKLDLLSSREVDDIRDALQTAMEIGLPEAPAQRATLRWKDRHSYTSPTDSGGVPFDLGSTSSTTVSSPDVQIPVALEVSQRPVFARDVGVGRFEPVQVTMYVLDRHYASMFDSTGKRADFVVLDESEYKIMYEAPQTGLFSMTLHTFFCEAVDEG